MLNGTPTTIARSRLVVLPAVASGAPTPQQSAVMMSAVWWLASMSPIHARWAVSEVKRLFWPPIVRQQYRMYVEKNPAGSERIVGVITWAMLAPDTMKRWLAQEIKLLPDDWDGGRLPAVVDMIAPFGHAPIIIRDMRIRFAGQIVYAMRRDKQGKLRPVRYHGYSPEFIRDMLTRGQAGASAA